MEEEFVKIVEDIRHLLNKTVKHLLLVGTLKEAPLPTKWKSLTHLSASQAITEPCRVGKCLLLYRKVTTNRGSLR